MRTFSDDKTTFCFDLDGVICTDENGKYEKCKPNKMTIEGINLLYNHGNKILIDSARGSETGINWLQLTMKQLKDWGVLYDKLRVGVKFHADVYIDDKAL